ncbi:MAG TPA: family 16 glycoside hydrolase, partial [Niabella sp.]
AASTARELLAMNNLEGQFKSAALSLLYKSTGEDARQEIIAALASPDIKYRATAINLLSSHYTPQTAATVQEVVKNTTDPDQQADLLYIFGENKDKSAVPFLSGLLQSGNQKVQLAAIAAIAKAGQEAAITPLIGTLKSSNTEVLDAAKSALLTIKGPEVARQAAAALPQSSGAAHAMLLDIAAQRGGNAYASAVFADAASADAPTRLAAVKALPYVVADGDEIKTAALLNKATETAAIDALQQALYASVKNKKTKAEQAAVIQGLMQNAGSSKIRYYNVLAAIGGREALDIVMNEFRNGAAPEQKEAAVSALANWSDYTALDALYNISKDPANSTMKEKALSSFIAGINQSDNPLDQKVLLFRNAMELATTNDQKKQILSGIGHNSSLPALVFVSNYLDDPALQQTAVQSVMNMVLDHTDLYGTLVENIVNKAIALNKDGDASYQKAAWIKQQANLPKDAGFVSLFNGKDLSGWKGLVGNPISRAKMTAEQLAAEQKKADEQMRKDWKVENGKLVFEGTGFDNLCSQKMYQDFELFVDWRMEPKGDGGVYLRGSPQVQTWDSSRRDVGAQVGSGGLYNNQKFRSTPLVFADNPINEWNTFRIRMVGDKVTVYLNGKLVTDNVTLENYWDRNLPIFDKDAIELQAHGTRLEFRDVYVRELERAKPYVLSNTEKKEGFVPMFNGVNTDGWTGNTSGYFAQDGMLICDPKVEAPEGTTKNVYTQQEYSDFIMRFEFQLTPGANNGLGIRAPLDGDSAYVGMELQILYNEAPIYKDLHPYQYHGSVYGVIPAKRGYLKPVGEWNYEEVRAVGNHITVTLNGTVILDGDIAQASKNNTETADHKQHPGLLNKSGHIGFLGHGSPVKFRNLRIKDLSKQ